jgi:prophage regulatory protein
MAAPDTFLRDDDVTKVTGVPRSTRYAMIARGDFPRPVHLSQRSTAEISAWQQARVAERYEGVEA